MLCIGSLFHVCGNTDPLAGIRIIQHLLCDIGCIPIFAAYKHERMGDRVDECIRLVPG